ncbi:hypothetical protein GC175_18345 [bacterium]|nr:hypothetical protein [bacterium]
MNNQSVVPDSWKTDHLIVLVGGNPIPNYVVSLLLLNEEGTLHLIHSPETEEIAKGLARKFPKAQFHEVPDPANRTHIRAAISAALDKANASVGLNYTGGTKAMAVHAYQMVCESKRKVVLTYLDSRSLELRQDEQALGISVKFAVKPGIQDILDIQNISPLRPVTEASVQPILRSLNQALAQAHTSDGGIGEYSNWCCKYLRDDRGKLVEKTKDLKTNPIPFPDTPGLQAVAAAMREAFAIDAVDFDPQVVVNQLNPNPYIRKIGHLIKYLDGGWPEQLAMAAFFDNKITCDIHDLACSVETTERYNFEFDVAALQGYQLYAVSCTRSNDTALCKSKLFEAAIRAGQLGGDEAKVGLVCSHNDPEKLRRQVIELWRSANSAHIRVFGRDDLLRLAERFNGWLS